MRRKDTSDKEYPVFREGDRVIGTDAFDGNEDVVGNIGTVCLVEGDNMYSVEFDKRINGGHNCGCDIADGYGWHIHANSLAPYQEELDVAPPMAYDEVMI